MHPTEQNLRTLMSRTGVEVIGGNQRVIAYTVVASGGTGLLNITAAAHGLKKNQTIYIGAGAYAGTHRVLKVISANVFQIAGTFGATAAGNINLTASLSGYGFIVDDATGLVIAEFEPENPQVDAAAVIARNYVTGDEISIPFTKIRISAGDITVVRKSPRAELTYSNR